MLTIGEFSRLSRVSPRMLRYYDRIGLLHPEAIGGNGYRYYKQEQLADIGRIKRLKDYGFPLSEVKALTSATKNELLDKLRLRLEEAYKELDTLKEQLRRIEADILLMEGITMNEHKYHVILMQDPEQKVFSIRRTTGTSEYHGLFKELFAEMHKRGLKQAGPVQMLYHDEEFNPERSDVEAQVVVSGDSPDVKIKPAQLCAAVNHHGPYDKLHLAYEALCDWLAENPQYHICAPAIDRYLNDPDSTAPENLETGVLFPVEKTE